MKLYIYYSMMLAIAIFMVGTGYGQLVGYDKGYLKGEEHGRLDSSIEIHGFIEECIIKSINIHTLRLCLLKIDPL